jgi:FtsH-binding integral membrane protein
MDPQILRAGFRIATFVAATAALLLLVEPRDSAEFIVSAMALGIGLIFASLVAVLVWYSTPKMPREHNASVHRRRKER